MTILTLDKGQYRPYRADDIDPADRGFLLGDGVFETFRVADGVIAHLDAHALRLAEACDALDLTSPDWGLIAQAISGHDGTVRVTVTRGPGPRGLGVVASAEPRTYLHLDEAQHSPKEFALHVSTLRRSSASLAATHKTLGYTDNAAARREAVAAGADMALLLTTQDYVSGTDCANIFWIAGGQLFTPSIACAIRPGVMREQVLRHAADMGLAVSEGEYALDQLETAETIFVSNSVMGVVPAWLKETGLQPPHPLFEGLKSAIRG